MQMGLIPKKTWKSFLEAVHWCVLHRGRYGDEQSKIHNKRVVKISTGRCDEVIVRTSVLDPDSLISDPVLAF
jgi:hypothetical protein